MGRFAGPRKDAVVRCTDKRPHLMGLAMMCNVSFGFRAATSSVASGLVLVELAASALSATAQNSALGVVAAASSHASEFQVFQYPQFLPPLSIVQIHE